MAELVGRERELAEIDAFLRRAASGLSILVVEGEPGIGKSALAAAALDRAEACGMRTLACRPVAAEARLAWAALTDLLGPLPDAAFEAIPEPQRAALEAALLRRADPGARLLPRAVGAGALTMLRGLAEEQPLLLGIDDAHWIDSASASVIGFVARRLADSPIGILIARRPDPDPERSPLRELPAERVVTVAPSALSLSGTFHVLRTALGSRPTRPLLRRIHQASGGNPLLAIELARATQAPDRTLPPDAPMPVTESIRSLMARRIGGQPAAARRAMLIVALLRRPTQALLRRADRRAADTIDDLVAASTVVLDAGVLRFAHPLLADVARSWFGRDEIRAMHRRLANVAHEPEERARHRALGLDGPDADVAAELTDVAESVARTSAEAACELLELALAVTPEADADGAADRRLTLAHHRQRAGDAPGAVELLDGLITSLPPGARRARALEQRAQADWVTGSAETAVARCEEALGHPGVDGWLRGRILVTLARVSMDAEEAYRRATDALASIEAEVDPDPALIGEALSARAGAAFALGHGIDWATVERGLALEKVSPPEFVSDRISAALGAWLKYAGDLADARTWLRRTHDAAVAEGDEGSLPYALSHLPQLELWTGDWEAAHEAAHEHLAVAEWTGQEEQRLTAIYNLAQVDAHAGRLDLARQRVKEALPTAERLDAWNVYQLLSTLGFVELTAGDPAAALPHLERAHELYEAFGAGDAVGVHENLAEALVAVGDLARASEFIAGYVERATRLGRPLKRGPALRSRALLEAASGDLEAAARSVRDSLAEHDLVDVPFSRARTLLVAGQITRRRGERRAARDALEEAHATFDRLGAPQWTERAAAELARIPIRRATRPDELTGSERRIADLVAEGLSNSEVAARLFVTPKTVETNLTRIYAKLGIRSRSQLVARVRAMSDHPHKAAVEDLPKL